MTFKKSESGQRGVSGIVAQLYLPADFRSTRSLVFSHTRKKTLLLPREGLSNHYLLFKIVSGPVSAGTPFVAALSGAASLPSTSIGEYVLAGAVPLAMSSSLCASKTPPSTTGSLRDSSVDSIS